MHMIQSRLNYVIVIKLYLCSESMENNKILGKYVTKKQKNHVHRNGGILNYNS